MRTPLGRSPTSWSLHRTASTSDILMVTRRHARPASVPTDALSVTPAFPCESADGATADSPSSRRTSLRLAREGKTGESPRTPSVVPRPCEPRPANRTCAYFFNCSRLFAHRFAFSRPVPRVRRCLRASFRLAPCFSKRPCDLPENKTRDASDRLLPPERLTCTRTSCVPSSLRDFHRVDTPRSLGLRAV